MIRALFGGGEGRRGDMPEHFSDDLTSTNFFEIMNTPTIPVQNNTVHNC